MPSGWHAGAHHVRNFMDGAGDIVLRCKCGWSMPVLRDESEALAAEHMAQFPSDDPGRDVEPTAPGGEDGLGPAARRGSQQSQPTR